MTESAPSAERIFVSYRRDDAAYPAGWLVDRLAGRFGAAQVFKDVDSIQLGDDFERDIRAAVGSCAVLLAVIGARWLTVTGKDGRRRIDDPGDFVRLEIESALLRDVRVIPVLVDGARMPAAADLPPSLAGLAYRQALELSPGRFDTSRLFEVLDSTLSADTPADVARPADSLPGPAHGRADAPIGQDRGRGTADEPGTSGRGSGGGQTRPGPGRRSRVVTLAGLYQGSHLVALGERDSSGVRHHGTGQLRAQLRGGYRCLGSCHRDVVRSDPLWGRRTGVRHHDDLHARDREQYFQ